MLDGYDFLEIVQFYVLFGHFRGANVDVAADDEFDSLDFFGEAYASYPGACQRFAYADFLVDCMLVGLEC